MSMPAVTRLINRGGFSLSPGHLYAGDNAGASLTGMLQAVQGHVVVTF